MYTRPVSNYIKVSHPRLAQAQYFFFHDHDPLSLDVAQRASTRAINVYERRGEQPLVSVFRHTRELGDLPCVGACDVCREPGLHVVRG
jgi:hypothetical protein